MSILKRITGKKKAEAPEQEAQVEAAPVEKKTTKATKAKTKKATAPKASGKVLSELTVKTLLAPIVTEKSAHLADAGVYVFWVPDSANRVAVRQAFREMYKVTPVKVNVVRVHGKEHRFGSTLSRQSDWKKALVTVPKGTRIDIFEKV